MAVKISNHETVEGDCVPNKNRLAPSLFRGISALGKKITSAGA